MKNPNWLEATGFLFSIYNGMTDELNENHYQINDYRGSSLARPGPPEVRAWLADHAATLPLKRIVNRKLQL